MTEGLVTRLLAHADCHEHVAQQDDEQRQWAADLREAAAELARLRAQVEGAWMPIETAPVDDNVLLLASRYKSHAFIGRWGDYHVTNHPRITHWHPLPPPPPADTSTEGRGA